jgi:hypothetical protein
VSNPGGTRTRTPRRLRWGVPRSFDASVAANARRSSRRTTPRLRDSLTRKDTNEQPAVARPDNAAVVAVAPPAGVARGLAPCFAVRGRRYSDLQSCMRSPRAAAAGCDGFVPPARPRGWRPGRRSTQATLRRPSASRRTWGPVSRCSHDRRRVWLPAGELGARARRIPERRTNEPNLVGGSFTCVPSYCSWP